MTYFGTRWIVDLHFLFISERKWMIESPLSATMPVFIIILILQRKQIRLEISWNFNEHFNVSLFTIHLNWTGILSKVVSRIIFRWFCLFLTVNMNHSGYSMRFNIVYSKSFGSYSSVLIFLFSFQFALHIKNCKNF